MVDSLGAPLGELENSASELPPDVWRYRGAEAGSVIHSAFVFTFAKTNRGRLRESLLCLSLTSGPLFAGLLRTTDNSISELIESLGMGLSSLAELEAGSLDRLLLELESCLGCHIRSLNGSPEQLLSERVALWRKSRLVELSQTNRRAVFAALQQQVIEECITLERYLTAALLAMKQPLGGVVAKAEQQLPQLSWLPIQNYLHHADPRIARNRRQAIDLFPALVLVAIQHAGGAFCVGLRQVIDTGQPLVEYVAGRWQVRPVAVRGLRTVGYDDLGVEWADALRSLLQLLSAIPPEKHPRTRDQWQLFTGQAKLFSTALRQPMGAESVRLLMHGASRQSWARSQAAPPNFVQQMQGIEAFSEALRRAIAVWKVGGARITVRGQSVIAEHQLLTALLLSLGLTRLNRVAREWQGLRAKAEKHRPIGTISFPTLLNQPFETHELKIVQLASPAELKLEAAVMKHCVDSFVADCRVGKSVIFSVRSSGEKRLSTVELTIKKSFDERFDIRLIQHKGPGNGSPPRDAVQALNQFLAHLNSGACRHLLQRYEHERRLFNVDPALAKDYQMALQLRGLLVEKTNGRVLFTEREGCN